MQIRPRQNYPRIFNGFTSGAFLVWLGNFIRQSSMQDSHPTTLTHRHSGVELPESPKLKAAHDS